MYRDPTCYIADIEEMTGKANRTARRIMKKARLHYGYTGREKLTIQQVKDFLEIVKG